MRLSIEELMKRVNCSKWPQSWTKIYDLAMDDFEKNGCELTDPDYYDRLGDKYNILVKHRDLYKAVAVEIEKNKELSAFLALLVYALNDRTNAMDYASELIPPTSPDGNHNIAYDVLPALAMCSLAPYCHKKLTERNLPEEIVLTVMRDPENGIDEYAKRNNGAYGYHLLHWYQLDIDAKLFKIGSLSIELFATFPKGAIVFKNKRGDQIALADDIVLHKSGCILGSKYFEDEKDSWNAKITENDTHWAGHPYVPKGNVLKKEVLLSKSEWKKVLSPGDPVISIHIPSKCDFSPDALDNTFEKIKKFTKIYFPDFKYKAIYCHSWLLDPQLEELLNPGSNIVSFGKRFTRFTRKSNGTDVYYFVFMKPFGETDISDYIPKSSLEKSLAKHFSKGKAIYEPFGYFFP